jgi:plastocyanin
VCLFPGGTLTFTNSDTAPHTIQFDGSCPGPTGPIAPSSTTQPVTFPNAQTCTFHDAANPSNMAFQGTVAVTATGGY